MDQCKMRKTESKIIGIVYFRPIIPDEPDKIWVSPMRRNFTEIMNDIMFSGGSSEGSIIAPGNMEILLFIFTFLSVEYNI